MKLPRGYKSKLEEPLDREGTKDADRMKLEKSSGVGASETAIETHRSREVRSTIVSSLPGNVSLPRPPQPPSLSLCLSLLSSFSLSIVLYEVSLCFDCKLYGRVSWRSFILVGIPSFSFRTLYLSLCLSFSLSRRVPQAKKVKPLSPQLSGEGVERPRVTGCPSPWA